MARAAVRHELVVWQWNANGLRGKKASLQQYIGQAGRRPDVILLQETHSEAPPSILGYRSYASPPSARTVGKSTLSPQGNRIIDVGILSSVFSSMACPECLTTSLKLEERLDRLAPCAFAVACTACGFEQKFHTSKKSGTMTENNARLVYAMRQIGKRHAAAETFCKVMNMPPPVRHSSYDKMSLKLAAASQLVASKSMLLQKCPMQ